MKAHSTRIALALAATLMVISSTVGGADATSAGSVDRGPAQIEAGANRNSPHPAVLSYERPVFPLRVPNPPVSLEPPS